MPPDAHLPLAGIRILLIDDDLPSIKLLRACLVNEGCEIQSAHNAAEALGLLRQEPPRLVLLDLDLPDMSGLTLAKLIRSSPECRDTVIVAVTSRNGDETERLASAAGCAAYFRKPIDVLSMPASLARLLND